MERSVDGRTISLTRTYDAPVEDVWDACTNAERIPRWFLPVSGDLRPGGRFQVHGNASGTIERCDPPRSFAATWESGGQASRIELRLEPQAGGTLLSLRHSVPEDDHWRRFGPGAVGVGWDMAVMGLERHVASGEAVDPEQAAAWFASPEGREFVAASGRAWGEAHAAGGADAGAARAAADATVAAYTGAPSQT
jgi:uncharacterized protein YndB with AHSA1/START domain